MSDNSRKSYQLAVVIKPNIELTELIDWEDQTKRIPLEKPIIKQANLDEIGFIITKLQDLSDMILAVSEEKLHVKFSTSLDKKPNVHDSPEKIQRLTGNKNYKIREDTKIILYDWIYYYRDALKFTHKADLWEICRFR